MEKEKAKIRFVGIETVTKNIFPRPTNESLPPSKFHYDITATTQVNPPEKIVLITSDIKIREYETNYDCLNLSVLCAFQIENFDEVIEKKGENNYIVPAELDALLKSVSVSTTRGVLHSEVRGTFYFNAILPLIVFNADQIREQQQKQQELKTQ